MHAHIWVQRGSIAFRYFYGSACGSSTAFQCLYGSAKGSRAFCGRCCCLGPPMAMLSSRAHATACPHVLPPAKLPGLASLYVLDLHERSRHKISRAHEKLDVFIWRFDKRYYSCSKDSWICLADLANLPSAESNVPATNNKQGPCH